MATALSPDRERIYVLKCDRDLPTEKQSRFKYKLISYGDYVRSQDNVVEIRGTGKNEEQRTAVLTGSQERAILVAGLIGCENFFDENGVECRVPESNQAKERFLSMLKPEWRRELAQAILGDSDLGKEEEKNSASQSG